MPINENLIEKLMEDADFKAILTEYNNITRSILKIVKNLDDENLENYIQELDSIGKKKKVEEKEILEKIGITEDKFSVSIEKFKKYMTNLKINHPEIAEMPDEEIRLLFSIIIGLNKPQLLIDAELSSIQIRESDECKKCKVRYAATVAIAYVVFSNALVACLFAVVYPICAAIASAAYAGTLAIATSTLKSCIKINKC